jgi:hypothetical protein
MKTVCWTGRAIFGTYAADGRFRHLSETGFDIDPAER